MVRSESNIYLVKFIREVQVKLEAIPSIGAIIYNAIIKRILGKSEIRIAQDIVQNLAYRVIRYLDKYDPNKGTFETWVNKIFKNCYKDFLKKKS